jgi:hypothetical protein
VRERCYRTAFAHARKQLGPTCHNALHATGRADARYLHLSARDLARVVPRDPDFDCGAGYVHGLMMGVAQTLHSPADGAAFGEVCHRLDTRGAEQACMHGIGHVFMRAGGGDLTATLGLCRRLGPTLEQGCAAGAFHDYWLGIAGQDDAQVTSRVTDVRKLCAGVDAPLVGACWARSLSAQPPAPPPADEQRAVGLCEGLGAGQRAGCVTAASVLAARNGSNTQATDLQADQLATCNALQHGDGAACVRGVVVAMVTTARRQSDMELLEGCSALEVSLRPGCWEWTAQLLAVITDDKSTHADCPRLESSAAQRACRFGGSRSSLPIGVI